MHPISLYPGRDMPLMPPAPDEPLIAAMHRIALYLERGLVVGYVCVGLLASLVVLLVLRIAGVGG
jgi:hypothetical protein